MNPKFLVKLLELKSRSVIIEKVVNSNINIENEILETIKREVNKKENNQIVLNIYPNAKSITANLNDIGGPDKYFINSEDNKLYRYNIHGQNPSLVNGNYLIAITDVEQYLNKAYNVLNGELIQLNTYFDDLNRKLIINNEEEMKEGLLILTDDYKIYVKIGNTWFSK